ncbi:MAG: LysR family transcriptional regulator [Thalassospira sp.]|nr:LysR family transcriptional regulator [Thalassospira sp.]
MEQVSRLQVFLAVAKTQSFSKAGKELGISAPAVSKHIQALEERLSVKLFNRTTRLVNLTEEGALYADRISKVVEDLEEAENELHDLKACPTGTLKVNAPTAFGSHCLVQPLVEFANKYPNVVLDIDFDDRHVDVLSEGYDVVLRIGALPDSSLIARKLAPCPIYVCASPAFIEKFGMPQTPADLANLPATAYTRHHAQNTWSYKGPDGTTGQVELKQTLKANHADIMLEAAKAGLGITILPIFSCHGALASGDLVRLLPEYTIHPARNLYAIFPHKRSLASRVRLFVDHMTESMKQLPWT